MGSTVNWTIAGMDDDAIGLLQNLQEHSDSEGINIVRRVRSDWVSGAERFSRPEEHLLVATNDQGRPLALGGLTRCPDRAGALRVRRFYVGPTARRTGIATESCSPV